MGFEIIHPSTRGGPTLLEPGQCSLAVPGVLNFRLADLANKEITSATEVVMLADKLTRRIGFRKARAGEPSFKGRTNKTRTKLSFNVVAALRLLDVGNDDVKAVRGRFTVTFKDDMFCVQIPEVPKALAGATPAAKDAAKPK